MAIYLKYRLLEQTSDSARYEIATSPRDPDPVRVEISTAEDAPSPQLSGPKVAAHKAIRQIQQRRASEHRWPKGGVIQS